MAIPAFHTSLFALEPHITSDSDGWGMAYGEWLANKLRLRGYAPEPVRPDTCGWNMRIQQEGFMLRIHCMLHEARQASNFDALHLPADTWLWTTQVVASTPLFKGFFKKIDTGFAKNRLEQEISAALQAEADLHLLDEPEFDYGNT